MKELVAVRYFEDGTVSVVVPDDLKPFRRDCNPFKRYRKIPEFLDSVGTQRYPNGGLVCCVLTEQGIEVSIGWLLSTWLVW